MGRCYQVGLQNYWIEDGNLTIYTNANTWERQSKPFRLIQLALTPGEYLSQKWVLRYMSLGAFIYDNNS
jgi:hypothetical protein